MSQSNIFRNTRSANRGADVREVEAARVCAGAAILARARADAELRDLYRGRDIQRARAKERDPAAPLQ
jgi:hypothetical protein